MVLCAVKTAGIGACLAKQGCRATDAKRKEIEVSRLQAKHVAGKGPNCATAPATTVEAEGSEPGSSYQTRNPSF